MTDWHRIKAEIEKAIATAYEAKYAAICKENGIQKPFSDDQLFLDGIEVGGLIAVSAVERLRLAGE